MTMEIIAEAQTEALQETKNLSDSETALRPASLLRSFAEPRQLVELKVEGPWSWSPHAKIDTTKVIASPTTEYSSKEDNE